MTSSFCSVPSASLIYAGPPSEEEFNRIPLPPTIHEWKPARVETLLRNDGKEYEQRCHSKVLGDHAADSVTVIFQWFEYRPIVGKAQP